MEETDGRWVVLVEAHLDHLATLGRAPATLRAYRADLDDWGRILAAQLGCSLEELRVTQLTLPVLETALATYRQRRDQRYKPTTQPAPSRGVRQPSSMARRISTLRGLVHYAIAHHALTEDPTRQLARPVSPRHLPRTLADEVALRAVAMAGDSARWPARDRLIVALGLACGLRRAEIVALRMAEIHGTPPTQLLVTGKGNKERMVGVPPLVAEVLETYLPERRERIARMEARLGAFARRYGITHQLALRADAVILSSKLIPVRRDGVVVGVHADAGIDVVDHVVDRTLRRLAVRRDGHLAHTLRHTFATTALRAGALNLRELQDALGHESLATTQIYTGVTAEEVVRAMQTHPLGRAAGA